MSQNPASTFSLQVDKRVFAELRTKPQTMGSVAPTEQQPNRAMSAGTGQAELCVKGPVLAMGTWGRADPAGLHLGSSL